MLIEFRVENYRSFKELAIFSMEAAPIRSKNKELNDSNVFELTSSMKLLKTAALYGANASGKSNFAKALGFMLHFVRKSASGYQGTDSIEVDGFKLSTETENKPSLFEITFFAGKKYRYGFSVTEEKVLSEWLYHVPDKRESNLFIRDERKIKRSSVFKEGESLEDKTRDNALFLSVVAQFNGAISTSIMEWFSRIAVISGLSDAGHAAFTLKNIQTGKLKNEIFNFVRQMDLGISEIELVTKILSKEEFPDVLLEALKANAQNKADISVLQEASVRTWHKKYDEKEKMVSLEPFELLKHESKGTQKLFYLSGPIIETLQKGRTLIIDEFDARIHPLIISSIIKMFHSKEHNPKNAQLIFITHTTNLLSNKFFRRDQIWFTEKDRFGASELFSLSEYRVRNDASFEKDYIDGRYGAIPFTREFHFASNVPK